MRAECAARRAILHVTDPELGRDLGIFLRRNCGFDVLPSDAETSAPPVRGFAPGLVVVEGGSAPAPALLLLQRLRTGFPDAFLMYIATSGGREEGGDAFAAGADDVIRAPFTLREFGLRLRARLGSALADPNGRGDAEVPQVLLDGDNRLYASGERQPVHLTRAEAEVMAVLIRSGGRIVSRSDLAREIDDAEWEYGDRRFDVHVANIRKKLRKAFGQRYAVRSIRNEGYAFREERQP
ncbi:response regulator transcription factor [Acidimangrovimonas sediminis]|uniref:response regulator transcription factor n=1 Tax=Acidimangrovimonas sediminis TaxID=2056283 RepID=UPI001304DB20|nr:response regulator transcription factor [Acidimangrovimonas sediminis]